MLISDDNYNSIVSSDYKVLRCTNGSISNYTDCNDLFTLLNFSFYKWGLSKTKLFSLQDKKL